MLFEKTKENLKKNGFKGFVTIASLFRDRTVIPKVRGVYLILYPSAIIPEFKEIGSGGFFKNKNPNVSLNDLRNNWVDETAIVYIGKAGSSSGLATLHSRLKQYLDFGQGKAVGHWGGRYIWQLKCAEELVVCWIPTPEQEPSVVESYLINKFKELHGKRPYANLRD